MKKISLLSTVSLCALALGILLLGAKFFPAFACLGAKTPPGSPLGWGQQVPITTPTGYKPKIVTGVKRRKKQTGQGRGTVLRSRPTQSLPQPPPSVGMTSFQGFYTIDIWGHIKFKIPKTRKFPPFRTSYRQGTVVRGQKWKKGNFPLNWEYIPDYPTELVLSGMVASLLWKDQKNEVSPAELMAYLIEMGHPVVVGTKGMKAYGGKKLYNDLNRMIIPPPFKTPGVPRASTVFEGMLHRLTVAELVSGFPKSADPTYGARIRRLQRWIIPSVLAASKSKHLFVKRNATAMLAQLPGSKVKKRLEELAQSRDTVIKIRAMKGLIQQRAMGSMDLFCRLLKNSKSKIVRALAARAIGFMGGNRELKILLNEILSHRRDTVFLWSALSALVRLEGMDSTVQKVINKVLPLPKSPRKMIVREKAIMALAAHGHKGAQKKVLAYVKKKKLQGVASANKYLLIDTLLHMDPKVGNPHETLLELVKSVRFKMPKGRVRMYGNYAGDKRIQAYAIMHFPYKLVKKPLQKEFLRFITAFLNRSSVEGLYSFLKLAEIDEKAAVKEGEGILRNFIAGAGGPRRRFARANQGLKKVVKVVEIVGPSREIPFNLLLDVFQKAFTEQLYAKINRSGRNFSPSPPLLEQTIQAIGLRGSENYDKALKVLRSVLKSSLPRGRGEAALILPYLGEKKEVLELLYTHLRDRDAWVRLCSFLALQRLTGNKSNKFVIDWIFSPSSRISKAAKKWKIWVDKRIEKKERARKKDLAKKEKKEEEKGPGKSKTPKEGTGAKKVELTLTEALLKSLGDKDFRRQKGEQEILSSLKILSDEKRLSLLEKVGDYLEKLPGEKKVDKFAHKVLEILLNNSLPREKKEILAQIEILQNLINGSATTRQAREVISNKKIQGILFREALYYLEKKKDIYSVGFLIERCKDRPYGEKVRILKTLARLTGKGPKLSKTPIDEALKFYREWWKKNNKNIFLKDMARYYISRLESSEKEERKKAFQILATMGKTILEELKRALPGSSQEKKALLQSLVEKAKKK